ncbi:UNVERIFIED_CONTAM: hypothetical protein GTU68_022699 [Idotea baltica]|nr:hypothetical protein [Idotea baltica]
MGMSYWRIWLVSFASTTSAFCREIMFLSPFHLTIYHEVELLDDSPSLQNQLR